MDSNSPPDTHHEYVVPKSMPITVPMSSDSAVFCAAKAAPMTHNNARAFMFRSCGTCFRVNICPRHLKQDEFLRHHLPACWHHHPIVSILQSNKAPASRCTISVTTPLRNPASNTTFNIKFNWANCRKQS